MGKCGKEKLSEFCKCFIFTKLAITILTSNLNILYLKFHMYIYMGLYKSWNGHCLEVIIHPFQKELVYLLNLSVCWKKISVHLKVTFVQEVLCVCVCVCVVCVWVCVCECLCVSIAARLLINGSMMWYDINPIWLYKQLLQLVYGTWS